jgi:hypothetical protein
LIEEYKKISQINITDSPKYTDFSCQFQISEQFLKSAPSPPQTLKTARNMLLGQEYLSSVGEKNGEMKVNRKRG